MSGAEEGWSGQGFQLVPFGLGAKGGRAVEGRLAREGEGLRLEVAVHDPAATLRIPAPAPQPRRREALWQATCLELFLGVPGEERYREFNLSPSGDWNVYQLDGYRRGLRPDPFWTALPGTREAEEGGVLRLTLATPLPPELAAAPLLEAAVTAVLQSHDGPCDYWALRHPGPEPDFHHRDGFALRI